MSKAISLPFGTADSVACHRSPNWDLLVDTIPVHNCGDILSISHRFDKGPDPDLDFGPPWTQTTASRCRLENPAARILVIYLKFIVEDYEEKTSANSPPWFCDERIIVQANGCSDYPTSDLKHGRPWMTGSFHTCGPRFERSNAHKIWLCVSCKGWRVGGLRVMRTSSAG